MPKKKAQSGTKVPYSYFQKPQQQDNLQLSPIVKQTPDVQRTKDKQAVRKRPQISQPKFKTEKQKASDLATLRYRMGEEGYLTDEYGNISGRKPIQNLYDHYGKNIAKFEDALDKGMLAAGVVDASLMIGKSVLPQVGEYLTTQTPLKNAYKLNPMAFKPKEEMMYRGLGKEGFDDAIESGVLRPKQFNYPSNRTVAEKLNAPKQFDRTYYAPAKKFQVIESYGPEYMAEVPFNEQDFLRRYSSKNDWSYSTAKQIPISEAKLLQKHWLKGYKDVTPSSTKRVISTSSGKDALKAHKEFVENNPKIDIDRYYGDVKTPYVPPTTDPALMATLKEYKHGGVIKDDMGYWNPENWGKPVKINSNNITMKPNPKTGVEVPYDVLAISNKGEVQYMERGKDYKFKGSEVTEFPIAQDGAFLPQTKKYLQESKLKKAQLGKMLPAERKQKAEAVAQNAERRIKENRWIPVPEDIRQAAELRNEGAYGCIGGCTDILKEEGVIPNVYWSNTDFAKNAPKLGFPNLGYGIKDIKNLERGDLVQWKQNANAQGNVVPSHAMIYLGKDKEGNYRFFDNNAQKEKLKSEADVANWLSPERTKKEDQASIYKINPYENAVNTDPEVVKAWLNKKGTLQSQMERPALYNYSLQETSELKNNTPEGVKKFLEFANNEDKVKAVAQKLGVDVDEVHNQLLNTFGILGQENKWEVDPDNVSVLTKAENKAEKILTNIGLGKKQSVGPGQIKFSTLSKELKKQFDIKSPKDLYNWEKVIPLMTAINIENKKYLTSIGEDFSEKLIGEKGLDSQSTVYDVNRIVPYMYRGHMSNPKKKYENRALLDFRTLRDFQHVLDPGYAKEVYNNIENNLQRQVYNKEVIRDEKGNIIEEKFPTRDLKEIVVEAPKKFKNGGELKKLDQLTNFTNYNDMRKAQNGDTMPRKVETIPTGYKPYGKDAQGRDLFIFEQQQVKPAKPSVKKPVATTSVQKPVKPKPKIAQQAVKDIVYMEAPVQQQQPSTEPTKAMWPEVLMSPGGYGAQAAGRFRYMTRDTPDWKKYAGDTSTFDKAVDFVFTDRDGNPIKSRGRYVVPADQWDKITKGTYGSYDFDEKVLAPYKVEYKYGGLVEAASGIHIKPSKKGTFTAAATKHGKGVQAFASQVLANKENYSPAMVKKANFARNAAKWKHENGGEIEPFYYAEDGATMSDNEKQDLTAVRATHSNWRSKLKPALNVSTMPAQKSTMSVNTSSTPAQKQAVARANKMANPAPQEEEQQNQINYPLLGLSLVDRLTPYQPIHNNEVINQYGEGIIPSNMGSGDGVLYEQGGVVGNRYISGSGIRFKHGGEIMNVASPENPITRMGGHFSSYEQGGELSLYDDTTGAQPISDNLYSNEIVEFKGPSHEESNNVGSKGIPMNWQGNNVEVEGKETGFADADGNFHIFGNLKSSTGRLYKNEGKRIAKQEVSAINKLNKAMDLVNKNNPEDPYERLKFNTGVAKKLGAEIKMKKLTQQKEALAAEQQAKLDLAEALGIQPKDLNKAKYGKFMKAQGGMFMPSNVDDYINPIKERQESLYEPMDFKTSLPKKAELSGSAKALEAYRENALNTSTESDVEGFDYSQIAPELLALGTNAVQPVPSFIPAQPDMLQAYNISAQDQLAANERSFRAMQQIAGNNPQALSALAAQKYAADQDVVTKNQLLNQQMQADVINQNRQIRAGYNTQKAQAAEQQFLRQEGARAKTKEIDQAALQSIVTKIATDKATDREYKIMENLYGFRFDENGKPIYKGKSVNLKKMLEIAAEQVSSNTPKEKTTAKYGMSINRQFKKYS